MQAEKKLDLDYAKLELLENGVILIRYKSEYQVELNEVKEVEKAFVKLSEGKDIYCLMDTSGRYNNFTSEAQKFLSNEASIVKDGKLKACATVINNLPNRLFIQLFSNFFKPKFLLKIFSNEKEAMNWLESKIE